MVKLKSGQMFNLDAVVAVTKANENWAIRLNNGDSIVIEPEDLNLFESEPAPAFGGKKDKGPQP
jgi:hypothetical protein